MEAQEVSRCWEWETYVHNPATVTHHVSPDTCQDNVSTGNVSSPRSDSGLNSLEYWDYSVELECITGQQGNVRKDTCSDRWHTFVHLLSNPYHNNGPLKQS